MKAKDLMIGDWVNVVVKWKPEVRYMQGEVSELLAEDGWLRVLQTYDPYEDNPVYCICDTQGIPLTPEILENNGYKYRDWWYEQEGYPDITNMFTDDMYAVGKHHYYGNGQPEFNSIIKIQYVHELQHALKLCGIEKEIVL